MIFGCDNWVCVIQTFGSLQRSLRSRPRVYTRGSPKRNSAPDGRSITAFHFFALFANILRTSAAPREIFLRRLRQPRSSRSERLFCEKVCSSFQQCGRGLPRAGSPVCLRGTNVWFAATFASLTPTGLHPWLA